MNQFEIGVADFRRKCASLMAEVENGESEFIITKHGKPIAKLVKYLPKPSSLIGIAQDEIEITGDIVAPISDLEWGTDLDITVSDLESVRGKTRKTPGAS